MGDDWDKVDSLVVKGAINKADFKTLYNCSRLGKLTVLNLEGASIEGNRIPDFALYYPNITSDYLNILRIILPNNVTEIGEYSFGNMRLKKINFPASLKKFSRGSFNGCHWMEVDPLIIPEGITEIPQSCFAHCQSFRKLVFPQSLKILGAVSFYNTRMEEMNLPDGLETIEEGAFGGSGELKRVVIPESVTKIGEGAFAQTDSLKSINIPHGITEIPNTFLSFCSHNLDSIIIPDNITRIGSYAFQLDYALSYIQWPKYLKRIDAYAFYATSIIEIVLPETLEFIGVGAFYSLESLEKVYCMAKIPPTAALDAHNSDDGPFYWSARNITLYVPKGSGDLYRTASGWQDFYKIEETDNFPSSCGITFAPNYLVTASNGTITINNPSNTPVSVGVYTLNGSLITQGKVTDQLDFVVPQGIYLVKVGNKTYKIII